MDSLILIQITDVEVGDTIGFGFENENKVRCLDSYIKNMKVVKFIQEAVCGRDFLPIMYKISPNGFLHIYYEDSDIFAIFPKTCFVYKRK